MHKNTILDAVFASARAGGRAAPFRCVGSRHARNFDYHPAGPRVPAASGRAAPRCRVIVSRPRAFLCCWLPWGHRFFGWAPSGFFAVRALPGRSLLWVGFPPSCPCDAGGSVSFSRLRIRGLPVAFAGLVARFLSLRCAVCGSSPLSAACRSLFPLSVRSPCGFVSVV